MKESIKRGLVAWLDAQEVPAMLTEQFSLDIIAKAMVTSTSSGDVSSGVIAGLVLIHRQADPDIVKSVVRDSVNSLIDMEKKRAEIPTAIIRGILCRYDLSHAERLRMISEIANHEIAP